MEKGEGKFRGFVNFEIKIIGNELKGNKLFQKGVHFIQILKFLNSKLNKKKTFKYLSLK